MYLAALTAKEKSSFLELAYKLAYSDRAFTSREIKLLEKYKTELGLDVIPATATIESLIADLAQASEESRKIVFFEAYGIVLADEKIAEKESEVVLSMKRQFGLSDEVIADLELAAEKLQDAYEFAHKAVIG